MHVTIDLERATMNKWNIPEEIERMVREAEEFAEEDKKVKGRIDARNGLESYLYNLKNTLEDEAELDDLNRLDELEDELDVTTETI